MISRKDGMNIKSKFIFDLKFVIRDVKNLHAVFMEFYRNVEFFWNQIHIFL